MANAISTYQYSTSEEREQIMLDNGNNRLIEEQNIVDGNFLIFDDLAQEKYIKSLEDQLLLAVDAAEGGIL